MDNLNYLNTFILRNSSISIFRVFKFTFKNKFQDIHKTLTEDEQEVIIKIMNYKELRQISFWEAALDLISDGMNISNRMLEHVVFHNENNFYEDFNKQGFVEFIKTDIGSDVALNSKVVLNNGKVMHIPMLDFKLTSVPENLSIIENILKVLKQKGMILNSGKSYHFIGYTLITENELINLLSKFILIHPISDKAWAAHQIIERSASLRISKKYGVLPSYIKEIL